MNIHKAAITIVSFLLMCETSYAHGRVNEVLDIYSYAENQSITNSALANLIRRNPACLEFGNGCLTSNIASLQNNWKCSPPLQPLRVALNLSHESPSKNVSDHRDASGRGRGGGGGSGW